MFRDALCNSNFEAPYYSVYSSDRLELANAYYTAIFDYLPRAIERGAKVFKCPAGAASFPVTLNPYKILRVDDKADGGPYSDDLSEKCEEPHHQQLMMMIAVACCSTLTDESARLLCVCRAWAVRGSQRG